MSALSREHARFRILAAAAVDGRISAEEAEELEAHLVTCPDCRADQLAMLRDHEWLATPGPVAPPNERVRAAVLRAARSTPRSASSPWVNLLAASLVLTVVGVAALELVQGDTGVEPSGSRSPSLGPSRLPPPSAASGMPRVDGSGSLVAVDGAGLERELSVSVAGGMTAAPNGSVTFTDGDGATWTGTITSAGFWSELNRSARLAFVQGCRGTAPCEHFRLELMDSTDGNPDQIRLSFPGSGLENPSAWEFTYELAAGSISVVGELPTLNAVPSLGAGQLPTLPTDLTPFVRVDGTMAPEGFVDSAIAVDGIVVGGTTGRVGDSPRPITGHINFAPTAVTGWTLAPNSVEYWNDVTTRPGVTVSFIQGCIVGPTCTPVAVMFVDNENRMGFDPIYIHVGWTLAGGGPGEETLHYSVADTALTVGGCMVIAVQAEPQRSILPDERC